MQHEITRAIPLLDKNGDLTEPGYCRTPLPVYRRAAVKGGKTRLKEWDYYLVTNGRMALALTIADNSYMGLDSISLLNFETGEQTTKSPMRLMPMGRTGLPESSAIGDAMSSGRGYGIFFENDGLTRTLICHMDRFGPGGESVSANVRLTDAPKESMVIMTPFDKPGHFYYNRKINCMRADGWLRLGPREYRFDGGDSFGLLDWGRGVWTYENTWYWSSASGLCNGLPFGFNLGYGFGSSAAATENMLFYNGVAHKLGHIRFEIPRDGPKYSYLSPWRFMSDDGRFEADFVPVMDRASKTSVGVIKSDQHQVFGRFTGVAVLDDGTAVELKDFFGFAERVVNKW